MSVWEIVLIAVALSMDAFAVGMTNGMTEPRMGAMKMLALAATYGGFQFLMPVAGYYCGYAFAALVEKIAPWFSFAVLSLIGGNMIFEFFKEQRDGAKKVFFSGKKLGAGQLLAQGVATSIDAFAVGITFLAAETTSGLPFPTVLCALLIGGVTFALSTVAVVAGKKIGGGFSDKAGLFGGVILIAIGLKILLEGIL